jgi:hypothetical protein
VLRHRQAEAAGPASDDDDLSCEGWPPARRTLKRARQLRACDGSSAKEQCLPKS